MCRVASTTPQYEITSPIFDKITIQLDNRYYPGKEVVIETVNNSPKNVYIQRVSWNGVEHSSFQLAHEELVKGGHLVIELGDTPNKSWGVN